MTIAKAFLNALRAYKPIVENAVRAAEVELNDLELQRAQDLVAELRRRAHG